MEVNSWKNTGANHYYVFFPTLGFFKNNQKVSTNNFTGADIQPNTNYQYRGQFFALDPCAGIITDAGLGDYSLGDDKTSMQLGLKYHVFCDSEIMTPGGAGSTHFIYSQTCFVGRVVRLGVMNSNPGKLSWVIVHDHVETNYDFHDPEFLRRINDIYPDAWKDFNQLIKRGYTISK